MSNEMIKLNIGCGGRPLKGYTNIDMDSLEDLKKRYPHQEFEEGTEIFNYDIKDLPYKDGTVSEIKAAAFIEHLSFKDEKLFFHEIKRVLMKDGTFEFSVPNFEKVVKMWLEAKDDWKDFYRDDDEAVSQQHWFGNYSYSTDNRWGYLTAMIFGSQNGEGQYHVNAYTIDKIKAMMAKLDFDIVELDEFLWKGERDPMIKVIVKKNN